MESQKTPARPRTNKLKFRFRDLSGFMFSHMNLLGDDFKRIQTGFAFGFVTMCSKSIEVESSYVTIRPSQSHVYLYFKCPTDGTKATLINSDVELFDTEDHYLVLFKSSTYNELQF